MALARNIWPRHWDAPDVLSRDLYIATKGTQMSATYLALVGPCVPLLPLDRSDNLHATVTGTGPGLGVVDLDTNVRDLP